MQGQADVSRSATEGALFTFLAPGSVPRIGQSHAFIPIEHRVEYQAEFVTLISGESKYGRLYWLPITPCDEAVAVGEIEAVDFHRILGRPQDRLPTVNAGGKLARLAQQERRMNGHRLNTY